MTTTTSTPAQASGAALVSLLVPGVGRVLALRTAARTHVQEYLIADATERHVYITDMSADGTPPKMYGLIELGALGAWLQQAENLGAVAALIADDAGAQLGPLSLARAAYHMVHGDQGVRAAVEHAHVSNERCITSEAGVQAGLGEMLAAFE